MTTRKLQGIGATAMVLLMAGCGGGGGGNTATSTPAQPVIPEAVGTDPLSPYAWHLENAGPSQIVSAIDNSGAVAGMDANLTSVHANGKGLAGKGVTIAIVDSGLEIAHEDLIENVLAGKSFNFSNGSSDPSPAANQIKLDHGTGVAGVAAARGWNNKGSRGTGPFASLVGFPTVGVTGIETEDAEILAFGGRGSLLIPNTYSTAFGNRAEGVHVFNYSAGVDYAAPASDAQITALDPMTEAIKWGTANLRGGKGAIYFQAAGNEFTAMKDGAVPGGSPISVNCAPDVASIVPTGGWGAFTNQNLLTCGSPNHEPNMRPYAYTVAALNNRGVAASYSSAGASNWITGFGGEGGDQQAAIVSTDNSGCSSGNNNKNNRSLLLEGVGNVVERLSKLVADLMGASSIDPTCNYTGQMNGTSAATPSVSGIAALILEANPNLTWKDVGYILAKTARKVDVNAGTASYALPGNAPLELVQPWITNAAGFNFHNRYGFGLVNTAAAVALAKNYTAPVGRRVNAIAGPSTTNTTWSDLGGMTQASLYTNLGVTTSTEVSGTMQVDIEVSNNTNMPLNPGQLQFELASPARSGERTKSILLHAFTSWYVGGDTASIAPGGSKKFRFFSNALYGETIPGAGASGQADTYQVNVIYAAPRVGSKDISFTAKLTAHSI